MNPLRKRLKRSAHHMRVPLAVHVLLMVFGALILLAALLWLLLGETTSPLSPSPDDTTVLEVIRLAFYAVAGIGGVIALTVAYRRQRQSEGETRREDAKLFNERFAAAAEQLASERTANRLAGVYAMAALADDWDSGRQTCVDVLCAYMRMPYEPPPRRSEREEVGLDAFKEVLEERLVRKTLMHVIAERLRADAVKGRTWHWCTFDFTGATIDEADFRYAAFHGHAVFAYVNFPRSTINFSDAKFDGLVDFHRAVICGSRVLFQAASFRTADFRRLTLAEGAISFEDSTFRSGDAVFTGSTFSDGTLNFNGCEFGSLALFDHVAFTGSDVSFRRAEFNKALVDFTNPTDWAHPPRFDDFPDGPPPGLRLPESAP